MSVTPTTALLAIGGTQQFMVTAEYTDGTTADVTALVTWSSTTTSVATVDEAGLATAVAEGSTFIEAELEATDNTFVVQATLTVTVDGVLIGTFSVGGVVSGLAEGASLVLQNQGADALTLDANGPYAFATELESGVSYDVTVLTQPTGQTCAVSNGSGVIAGADVDTANVACAANPAFTISSTSPANGDYVTALSSIVVVFNREPEAASVSDLGNYTLGGAGVGTLAVSTAFSAFGSSNATISLSGDSEEGEVTLAISGVVAQDGTPLSGLDDFSYFVDTTAPDFSSVTPSVEDTQGLFDEVAILFSEVVEGADDVGNYSVSGSAAANLAIDSIEEENNVYTIVLSGVLADGTLEILVSVTDLAGNFLEDGTLVYDVDVNNPTVSADPAGGSLLNALTTLTLTFSDGVTGADTAVNYDWTGDGAGGLAVTNSSGSGDTFTLTLSGSPSDGEASLVISNVINGDSLPLEGNTITYEFDVTRPAAVSTPEVDSRLTAVPDFSIAYGESMSNAGDPAHYTFEGAGAGTLFIKEVSVSSNVATLTHYGYPGGGSVSLVLSTEITDLAGNEADDLEHEFSVGEPFDLLHFWPCLCGGDPSIRDIATDGSGEFVAVGDDGQVHHTSDGTTWVAIDLGSGGVDLDALIHDGSNYIAVAGQGNALAVSSDGTTWEWRAIPTGNSKSSGIAYNGSGTWVVTTTSDIFYSTDLKSWSEADLPSGLSSTTLRALTSGNGIFMAVTDDDVITSADGMNWSIGGDAGITFGILDVAYGEPGSTPTFLVMDLDGTNARSTDDGESWTSGTTIGDMVEHLIHDGNEFIAFGLTNNYYRTGNGVAWQTVTSVFTLTALAGDAGFGHWVAATLGGTPSYRFAHSGDITSDNFIPNIFRLGEGVLQAVSAGNGWVVTGTSESEIFRSSTQGATWLTEPKLNDSGDDVNIRDLAYGDPSSNPTFVAVGENEDDESNVHFSTNNGQSWTNASNHDTGQPLLAVTYDPVNEVFIAVGEQLVRTASNPATWLLASDQPAATLRGVASDGTVVVAVGDDGGDPATAVVYRSTNGGDNWSQISVSAGDSLRAVVYDADGDIFIAVGDDGIYATSEDGLNWSVGTFEEEPSLTALASDGSGNVLAVGSGGDAASTGDGGITWLIRNSGSQVDLAAAAYGGTYFLVVGDKGTVLAADAVE